MMTENQIKDCTVALKNVDDSPIGSGILYCCQDYIYVLTCAHCVLDDSRNTPDSLLNRIKIVQYANQDRKELLINIQSNKNLFIDTDNDIAILIVNKNESSFKTTNISSLLSHEDYDEFRVVGFPMATRGKEHMIGRAIWNSQLSSNDKFLITLQDDISEDYVKGLSGGGTFVKVGNDFYFIGIVQGFRGEERGRVLKIASLSLINSLLTANYKETINISFIGTDGINENFFKEETAQAIKEMSQCDLLGVNIRFEISNYFDYLTKTDSFYQCLRNKLDNWILDKDRIIGYSENKDLEPIIKDTRKKVIGWLSQIKRSPDSVIDISHIVELAEDAKSKVHKAIDKFKRELHGKEYSEDSQRALSILYSYYNYFDRLTRVIDRKGLYLSNHPFLIIYGEAGCGKSHMFADTAKRRIEKGLPTILLHARNFSSDITIEENIVRQLKLGVNFKDLMYSLNRIGLQINSRVLILIDAINETRQRDLWRDNVLGLIFEMKKYPGIAFALSVRDTYMDDTLPNRIIENSDVTLIEHKGFTGNLYDIISAFCISYKIKTPNFPILNPEFGNPLFLHMVCRVVKYEMNGELERGMLGIYKVFDGYKRLMDSIFDKTRSEYKRHKIASRSIDAIVSYLLANDTNEIPYFEAENILKCKVLESNTLINDLIDEFVLKLTTRKGEDYVTFAYERMGEFYEAMKLAHDRTPDELSSYIEKTVERPFNSNIYGIMDQLAIILPEVHGIELYEVTNKGNVESSIFDSLIWRSPQSINKKKILDFFNGQKYGPGDGEWLTLFFQLSCIPDNPFNGDYFCKLMEKYSMPERDQWFQKYLYSFTGTPESPIDQMIDWAWSPGISLATRPNTALLASKALMWVLSSTSNGLRDKTTKALVNLLQHQCNALLNVMSIAEKQDDQYITERIYGIAYGCVLRCNDIAMIKEVALHVYSKMFEHNDPPCNILLRDYASCIIDYAVYRNLIDEKFLPKSRPPYNADLPEFPSEEEIDKYKLPYDKDDGDYYKSEQNQILSSVVVGIADFGHYIVESACNNIANIPLEGYRTWKSFKSSLSSAKKRELKNYITFLKIIHSKQLSRIYEGNPYESSSRNLYESIRNILLEDRYQVMSEVKSHFTDEEAWKIENVYFPYLERKNIPAYDNKINAWPVRYWIVKRVFELGYDRNKHGEYDSMVNGYFNATGDRVERIGKKYKWIAFFEIMGRLTDNYLVGDYFNDKPKPYKGAWFAFLRNFDFACITKSLLKAKSWMKQPDYIYWNLPYTKWRDELIDFPDITKYIWKTDEENNEWLSLHNYYGIKAPKFIGIDEYSGNRRGVNLSLQSFIVKTSTKARIVHDLQDKKLWNVSKAEFSSHNCLMTRELGWSQCYLNQDSNNRWTTLCELTRYKVLPSVENLNGNIEGEHSGINLSYMIPCIEIINSMGLVYSDTDGQMLDKEGNLISTYNKDDGNDEVLIKKRQFVEFLHKSNLDIIWTISIEKNCYGGARSGDTEAKVFDGVFYLDVEDSIKGHLNTFPRWHD